MKKTLAKLFSTNRNFYSSVILIILCALIFVLTAFCFSVSVEMEFEKGTAVANGYELTFRLMNKYMPGFPSSVYIPLPAIVVLTAFMTAAILILTLVNIIILAAYASLKRRPCVLWSYLLLFLASIIIVGVAVMCMVSNNEATRELTATRPFKIGAVLIIQPFLILGVFFLSFMFNKGIFSLKRLKKAKKDNEQKN